MSEYLLSWSVGVNADRRGGRRGEATWADVKSILDEAFAQSGTVTVDVIGGPEVGPQSLQVRTANGLSIITLGVDNGEDYIVRSYSGGRAGTASVEILGDVWASDSICPDFKVVTHVFKEFLDTGDVSAEFLS